MTPSISEIARQVEVVLHSNGFASEAQQINAASSTDLTMDMALALLDSLENRVGQANIPTAYQIHQLKQALTRKPAIDFPSWLEGRQNNLQDKTPDTSLVRPSGLGDRSHMRSALKTMVERLSIDSKRAEMTGSFDETFDPKNDKILTR